MHKDGTIYRKQLPKLFSSLALIVFSLIAVANSFIVSGIEINTNLIIFMLKVSIPASFVLGYIGYLIGQVLDNRNVRKRTNNRLYITQKDADEAYSIGSIFAENGAGGQLSDMSSDEPSATANKEMSNEV